MSTSIIADGISETRVGVSHTAPCNGPGIGFREAQLKLWGEAGAWSFHTWHELHALLFGGELDYAGVVWGFTPYGHCLGHCESSGRITLHRSLVDPSTADPSGWSSNRCTDLAARDVLAHEMVHALLFRRGVGHDDRGGHHNLHEWCAEIERLSPVLFGAAIKSEPVKPRRIEGKVRRNHQHGYLSRGQAARWPHSVRRNADSYYACGRPLSFDVIAEGSR